MSKYKYTGETKVVNGVTLKQIVATRNFGTVKKGSIGGWVGSHKNLSHRGHCWVHRNAKVLGNAEVSGNAKVF